MELDHLRSRLDILELAKDYVRDLKRAGKSWTGLCPFHEERTPSFHISPEKGVFHCFGCNAGGDAIAFYMKAEGLGFRETVEALCERHGIPKPKGWGAPENSAEAKMRSAVQKALQLASQLYAEALWLGEDPLAESARNYLFHKRRIEKKVIQNYKIGLAPRGPNWLLSRMVTKHGIEPRVLEKAGLVTISQRDGRYLDFFRGRILFPVYDLNGRVAGFGGRILVEDDKSPKYLNSVDSPWFKKGEMLYGLNEHKALIRSAGKAYLVEGYFDATGMAQAGVSLAVSPMGGALSPNHARLLRRFTNRVVMLFDPDQAGISGAIRAARMLAASDMQVTVLKIPSGMDPDEYLLAYGKAAFEVLEHKEAKGFVDFELEYRLTTAPAGASDLHGRMAVARSMMASLAAITSEVERRESLVHVSQVLRLDPVGLERELWSVMAFAGRTPAFRRKEAAPVLTPPSWELTVEESLLGLAHDEPEKVRLAVREAGLTRADFQNPKIGEYFFPQKGAVPGAYDAEWQEIASRAVLGSHAADASGAQERLNQYVGEIKKRKMVQEAKRLREAVTAARQQGKSCDPEILQRYYEISRMLKQ